MYNLRLLNLNRERLTIIDPVTSWRYTRRPSEATEITVTLPRSDVEAALPAGADIYAFLSPAQVVPVSVGALAPAAGEALHDRARIAYMVEIYRGTEHVVTGRISHRDIGDETVTITCHTEEILLEANITPAQYGRVWDDWDLADVARDVLGGWHVQRVKDRTQWDTAIEAVNVDTATEPGVVMLAKDSSGRYRASGHITLRFSRQHIADFVRWDRIRWASDNAAPVRTTMQWRADGGAWSPGYQGALPDEIGVALGAANATTVDVRINLHTDDRDTEGPSGSPVGQTPYVFAVELIARTAGRVAAGAIPAAAGVTVAGLDADGTNALAVLGQACESVGWEFLVRDGKLDLARRIGEDRTGSVLLRTGTNMNVVNLTEGDDELVNIVTALGPGRGINRLQTVRIHEASVQLHGPYPGTHEFPHVSTLAELEAAADDWLDERAAIQPAFRVDVIYPYGEEPEFGVGDRVRVADPRNGIITTSRIMEEDRSLSDSGQRVTLFLGLPRRSLAGQVRPWPPLRETRRPRTPTVAVEPIPGGLQIIDTSAGGELTTDVYISTSANFEPSGATLVERGRMSRFNIIGLDVQRYYVRLVHVDDEGNRSEPSAEVSGVPLPSDDAVVDLDTPQWASPAITSGIEDVGQFILTWLAAHWQTVTDATMYQVQWRRGTSGDWQSTMTAETALKIAPLPANVSYQVRVRAARGNSVSPWSAVQTVTTPRDTQAPPAPVIRAHAATPGGFWIEMEPSPAPDWDGFEVHWSTSSANFTPSNATLKARGRQTRFEFGGLEPGQVHHVRVIAYDTSGNKSSSTY